MDQDTSLPATSKSFTSFPQRTLRYGDIGFLAHQAVQPGIDNKHHVKYNREVGIHHCDVKKANIFPALPGITFNEKSFASYINTASTMRRTMQQQVSPLRGSSPRKARGHH